MIGHLKEGLKIVPPHQCVTTVFCGPGPWKQPASTGAMFLGTGRGGAVCSSQWYYIVGSRELASLLIMETIQAGWP